MENLTLVFKKTMESCKRQRKLRILRGNRLEIGWVHFIYFFVAVILCFAYCAATNHRVFLRSPQITFLIFLKPKVEQP